MRPSCERVIGENFSGKLKTKFENLVRRWTQLGSFYPMVFAGCCALVNFDIRPRGEVR
jgi:hypothetical protein